MCGTSAARLPALAGDADELIRQGVELRRTKRDAEALQRFQKAYELERSPRVVAQMGLAEQALGRWSLAHRHLRQALESAQDPWIRKNRRAIEGALAAVDRHIGHLEISGTPAGAEVRIDGELVGSLPLAAPIAVAAGGVAIEVRAAGHLPILRAGTVGAGELARENFSLQPLAPSAEPPATSPPPVAVDARAVAKEREVPSSSSPAGPVVESASRRTATPPGEVSSEPSPVRRGVMLGSAGLAVAALAVGVVEHVIWQRRVESYGDRTDCDDEVSGRGSPTCQSLYEQGQRAKTLAFVGYGLTVGLAVTAAILYLTAPGGSSAPSPPRVACAPPSLGLGVGCAFRF